MSTWTREQSNAATGAIVPFLSNVKSGSLLVLGEDMDQSTAFRLPTDTVGTIYSVIDQVVTGGGQRITMCWGLAPSAGANSVLFSGGSFNGGSVIEFSVSAGTISLDAHNTQAIDTGAVGTDAFVTASVTASQNGSLGVSYFGSDNGGMGDLAAGTGCVMDAQSAVDGSANDRQGFEHDLTISAGAQTMPWSTTAGTARGAVHVAIFKSSADSQTGAQIPVVRHAIGLGRW